MKTNSPIEKIAHFNLALVNHCMALFWMADFTKREEISNMIKVANKEMDDFLEKGTIPHWIKETCPESQ